MFPLNVPDGDYVNNKINLNKRELNRENFEYLLCSVSEQKTLIEQQRSLIHLFTELSAASSPKSSSETPIQHILKSLERLLQNRTVWMIMAVMSLISLILVSWLILFNVKSSYGAPKPFTPPSNAYNDDLGNGIQIIHRTEWGARPPLKQQKILAPLKLVRILHTAGAFCDNYQTCASKVLAIQGWQVGSQGLPDIAYNYMIGGDGNVYEARGADIKNEWMPLAIDIGYMGNYLTPYDKLSDKMDEAGRRLVEWLRKNKKITPDYSVIAHNQTFNTQSPGQNVYKKIVQWPHYDSGLYFD